jgi:hypothetical protein
MNQAQSAQVSQIFAEAWSAWSANTGDPHEARSNERKIQSAVFNQCFEFLPEDAVVAVIERGEESPGLFVLKDNRLYVLSLKSPVSGQAPAITECDLHILDPKQSTVICQTKYIGERVNDSPMQRETVWRFRIADLSLDFETFVAPDRSWYKPDEIFAQALAEQIGWDEFPDGVGTASQ